MSVRLVIWHRRALTSGLLMFSMAAPGAPSIAAKALVYAAIGSELRNYDLDPDSASLSQRDSVTLPAQIQAGCPQPTGRYLYVAWSDGTNVSAGTSHGLSSFRIATASHSLLLIGQPVPLPSRPIYASADPPGHHIMVAYTNPSGVTVHQIAADGSTLPPISQPPLDLGIYGHQILVDPTGKMAIVVARGNVPTASHREDPGALNVFGYSDGLLSKRSTIAPNGGVGFHPRYVGFHPKQPWVYVSLSQQNELGVYKRRKDGTLDADRLFEANSLADPAHVKPGQLTGVLHVDQTGKFVYLANRSTSANKVDGKSVFAGGENSIAVFAINQRTGKPTLIQNIGTRGMGPVEFAFDPSGKILVVANMLRLWVQDSGSLTAVPPSLVIFRVHGDGKLEFAHKYDIDAGERTLFWMGVSPLPHD